MILNIIRKLIPVLPKKDINLAFKFLEKRELDNLKDLINSAIIIIQNNKNKKVKNKDLENINIEHLLTLKAEVDNYIFLVDGYKEVEEKEEYD